MSSLQARPNRKTDVTQTASSSKTWRFETVSVHGGYSPEPTTKSVAVPLYQTVAYAFDNAQHGAAGST